MAVAFRAVGTSHASTSSVDPGLPAGMQATDALLLHLVWRSSASAPDLSSIGMELLEERVVTVGSEGADSGSVGTAVYLFSDITPGEPADPTAYLGPSFSISGRNGAIGWYSSWSRDAGAAGWDIAATDGGDTTINTSHSAAGASNPGGTAGDVLISTSGTNGDAISSSRTSLAASWSGATLGSPTNRAGTGTTSGNDMRIFIDSVDVSSGTASGNPSVTWTWGSGSTANHPASAVVYVRLREDAGGGSPQDIEPSSVTTAEAFGTATVTPGAVTVSPSGIASAEAHGTTVVTTGAVTVAPTGIGSAETLGSPTLSTGAVTVSPSGIASAEAFGTAHVSVAGATANELEIAGINVDFEAGVVADWQNGYLNASTPLVGSYSLEIDDSVPSAYILGPFTVTPGVKSFSLWLMSTEPTAPVKVDFYLNGFTELRSVTFTATSTAAQYFDQVTFTDDTIDMINVGFDTPSPVGQLVIDHLSVTPLVLVSPSGISSGEDFGTPEVTRDEIVYPTGIASSEAMGTPTVTPGAVTVSPSSIASGEALGTPSVVQVVSPTGIATAEEFGVPALTIGVNAAGIASAEDFGRLVVQRQVFVLQSPVIWEEGPPPYGHITTRVDVPRSLTIYRVAGTWYSGRNLNRELENADRIYRGGYDNLIEDADERAELITAGYTFETRMQ